MKRVSRFVIAAAFAGATVVATSSVAGAEATVDTFEATCSSVQASGTTTAPYVGVWVYSGETTYFLGAQAANEDGTFSVSASFADLPDGTGFSVNVYGSTTDSPTLEADGWDNEAYYETAVEACTPASTTTTTSEPSTTSTTAPASTSTTAPASTANAGAARAVTAAPAFTG
jgi:hypothetical protein